MNVTNDQTIDAYDNGVQAYFDQSPQQVSGHIKNWIDTALDGLSKTAKIFEIGSATGKDAHYIESLGYTMELTDASKGFVDYLNQKGKTARQFNALTDDFGSTYDVIFADAVLLHFTESELKRVLGKIATALKPNGKLAFTVKKGDGESTESEKLGSLRYFHFWQPEQLENMLRDAGLSVVYQHTEEDNRGNKPAWILMVAEKRGNDEN